MQIYYGYGWLAMVYILWFTRERSKVRSLVRPPFKPVIAGLSPLRNLIGKSAKNDARTAHVDPWKIRRMRSPLAHSGESALKRPTRVWMPALAVSVALQPHVKISAWIRDAAFHPAPYEHLSRPAHGPA
jgi:hypothetical protein